MESENETNVHTFASLESTVELRQNGITLQMCFDEGENNSPLKDPACLQRKNKTLQKTQPFHSYHNVYRFEYVYSVSHMHT